MLVQSTSVQAMSIAALIAFSLVAGCTTGVEESPDAGILRVVMQSDPNDTTIESAGEVLTVSPSDSFGVTIFQGRAFRDTTFAVLFKSLDSYREQDFVYNVLGQEGGSYREYVIFESLVPPGEYDRLQFGVTADLLRIGTFEVPVQLPPEVHPSIDIDVDFFIDSDETTEIRLSLKPLSSVTRFRDTFLFQREFEVVGVN